ncbi:MAG: hypothetical protein H7039_04120 [Bryobacteraceae bacterium]|nr:hypothetical protein [Bryobacteraceae bacterium]
MDSTTDILAGPILRRVEPKLVSVWLALRFPATVDIELFRGQGAAGTLGPAIARQAPVPGLDTHTVAAGKNLHVVVSIWQPPTLAPLEPGQIYSYDIVIKADSGETARLKDLGFLSDRSTAPRWLALGYQQDWLPSFALVPPNLADLKIVQGSCRAANGLGRDAMPPIDSLIRSTLADPKKRPHMLFLTGDQIYADEPAAEHLELLQNLSLDLLGTRETIAVQFKATASEAAATVHYPLDVTHFPPGRRGHPLNDLASFTSTSTDSHVMGFGEYCALYLSSWSNAAWKWQPSVLLKARKERFTQHIKNLQRAYQGLEQYAAKHPGEDRDSLEKMIPYHDAWRLLPANYRALDGVLTDADREAAWGKGNKDDEANFFLWNRFWSAEGNPDMAATPNGGEKLADLPAGINTQQERNRLARALTPSWFAGMRYFGIDHTTAKSGTNPPVTQVTTKQDEVYNKLHRVDWFYQDLPRVRRLLANVPTYMVFDDHEITDDWNVTPKWAKQTRANALGRAVIRNGLAACTLFQSWGNDPLAYREGSNGRKVLNAVAQLFASPTPQQPGPDATAAGKLERLFDLAPPTPNNERMFWHFRYDGPGFEVIALDTRTWRGFEPEANEQIRARFDQDATATLLTDEAVRLQIPEQPAIGVNPDGVCIVIAAAPFLGYPIAESIVQPMLNLSDIAKSSKPEPPFVRWQKTFSVGRVAHDPENWGFVPSLFEAVLARLSTRRRVVFLSGDVHYGFTLKMTYWRLGPNWQPTSATRVAQLTASSFRAQRDDLSPIVAIDLAQQLGALSSTQKRLGWNRGRVGTPEARTPLVPGQKPFGPHLQLLLEEDPIVVSPTGIPATTSYQRDPQWAWETALVVDQRPDTQRLSNLNPPPFSKTNQLEMVRSVGERHFWQAQNGMPRSWQWWTNFSTVEFAAGPDGKPEALRHRIFAFDPRTLTQDMYAFTVAEIPLKVSEKPPEKPTV